MLIAGSRRLALVAALTIALLPPVALAAGIGRGYMAPLGLALLFLVMGQVLAATGWGSGSPGPCRPSSAVRPERRRP